MTDQPPLRVTLQGRVQEQPVYDEAEPRSEGLALPAPCIRRLAMPTDPGCQPDCVGRQRDGGCCADLVRGRESWSFTVDVDGFWVLSG